MQVTVGQGQGAVQRVRAEEPPQKPGRISAITGDEAVCP
jgi:hypothetical protein